jgi:6-phosphogluconolactonase
MQLHIAKDADELNREVALWITTYIKQVLKKQDRFSFALSGGNTPKQLYNLLASENFKNKIDWTRIHFFWGDERYVPITDEQSNAKMAIDALLNKVQAPQQNIHVMRTDMEQAASAHDYENLLRNYFKTEFTFDLVLLGLGNNAHTLSLFPHSEIIKEKEKWVAAVFNKEQNMFRITLTAPVVNAAHRVAFLVSGGDKAAALYQVLQGIHDPDTYPAQIIQPYNDELFWWADEAAAADLDEE